MDSIFEQFKKQLQATFIKQLEEKVAEITDEKDYEIEEITSERDDYYFKNEEKDKQIEYTEQICSEICNDARYGGSISIEDLSYEWFYQGDLIDTVQSIYTCFKQTIIDLVHKNKKKDEDLEKKDKEILLLKNIIVACNPKFKDSEILEKEFNINDYTYEGSYEQTISRLTQQQNKMLNHSILNTNNRNDVIKILNTDFKFSKINDIFINNWGDSNVKYEGNKSFNGLLKALDIHVYDVNAGEAIKKICSYYSDEIDFGISITLSSGNIVYITNYDVTDID